jgi:single-strand DNA-binding protein
MANLNKVMLIGRLTRDPEIKEFSNGGKVANIGFVVNNRRKNQQSGQWEEVPVWVDLKAFNRDSGRKLADLIEKSLHKGNQVYVEGHLVLEEWAGKEDGKKQSKMVVYVDDIEFLEKREGGAAPAPELAARSTAKKAKADGEGMEDIPF